MPRSLRARLVAGLLALSAVGLLVLAGITYAEQHKFLYDRLDRQTQSALFPATSALVRDANLTAMIGGPGPFGGGGPGGPGDDGGRRDGPSPLSGAYGQLRSANGTVITQGVFGLQSGEKAPAAPKLGGSPHPGEIRTVDAKRGSLRYRVAALTDPRTGLTTVVGLPMRDTDQTLHRLLRVLALVIVGVLAALGIGGWLVVRRALVPLDRMGETAGRIAGGDLSHRVEPATPDTEVGRLGLALNGMLGRLEQAFAERSASEDRLRTFLADASHELRTPLSSIRGYAELFRLGVTTDSEQLRKSMRRIEEEAARMGVLVEDLLTLARLDEVRDVLLEETDVAAIARDAVDDARVTQPDRPITGPDDGPALVFGDAHQLRQVLANLLRNALTHTPGDAAVEVSARQDGDAVELVVRDHGPGLPGDDPEALFARFWRAEGGRERGRGGAGLGLAIVAGIVDAHGGEVHATNDPDGGARFTVRLPAADPVSASPPAPVPESSLPGTAQRRASAL